MRKKIPQIYVEKRPSSRPSYWHFVIFLPKKQHYVTSKKTFITNTWWVNRRNGQPSWPRLQLTFPQKTASVPASEGVRLTGVNQRNTLKTHQHHHHDMYHHALFRSRSASFLCEFTAVCLKEGAASLCVNHHRRRIVEPLLLPLCVFSCVNGATVSVHQ